MTSTTPEAKPAFSAADESMTQLLARHAAVLAMAADRFVDLFYAQLGNRPETAAILRRLTPARYTALKAAQRVHALRLLMPGGDQALAAEALRVGHRHALVGVQADWLSASFGLYADCLLAQLQGIEPLADRHALQALLTRRLSQDLTLQLQGSEAIVGREREVMERIDLLLLSDKSPEALPPAILNLLLEMEGISGAWIGHPDRSGRFVIDEAAGAGMADFLSQVEIRSDDSLLGQGPSGRAWRSGTAVISDDWGHDGTVAPWREQGQAQNWRSSAAIPIHSGGEPVVLLTLYSAIAGFFAYPNRQLLIRHLATMFGVTMAQKQNQRRLAHLQSLYRAFLAEGDILIKARSEMEMLRKTCQRLVDNGIFNTAYVTRPDAAGWFHPLAAAGVGSTHLSSVRLHVDGTGFPSILSQTWAKNRLHYHNDYLSDPARAALHPLFLASDCASIAAIPIYRDGKVWAILGVTSQEAGLFDQDTLVAVARIGKLLGHGLDELDLKDRMEKEREVQGWLARHDPLTGLPNRIALLNRVPEAMARALRQEKLMAICMLDLDDFKPVNDTYGHAAGDAILQVFGQRLQAAVRQTDFAARLGGDEFALVLENLNSINELERVLARVQQALETPFPLPDGHEVEIGGSLGFTLYPIDEGDPEHLLRHADQALYAVKTEKGRRSRFWSCFHISEGSDSEQARSYGHLLANGGLRPYYQPVLDLRSGRIIGVEALARLWDGTQVIPPAAFLPHLDLADQESLSSQMLQQAIAAAEAWEKAGFSLEVAINLPPEVLISDHFLTALQGIMSASSLPPRRLTLEILESGEFLSLAIAKERIARIRALGVRVALDDVGSAYASLLRLKELAVDEIKLDQGFVREIPRHPGDLLFVLNVRALAQDLRTRYVVEGAETLETLDALAVLGVEHVQGYAIARPMPEEAVLVWLQQYRGIAHDQAPRTLLGAYAAHLTFDSLYRMAPAMMEQLPNLDTPYRCRMGRYLDHHGLHGSAVGVAYQFYHAAIGRKDGLAPELENARLRLRTAMEDALRCADVDARYEPPGSGWPTRIAGVQDADPHSNLARLS